MANDACLCDIRVRGACVVCVCACVCVSSVCVRVLVYVWMCVRLCGNGRGLNIFVVCRGRVIPHDKAERIQAIHNGARQVTMARRVSQKHVRFDRAPQGWNRH